MRQCLVVGRPVLDEDVRLGHVALVKCEGSDGTCPRIVHPVCTLTPHMYRHREVATMRARMGILRIWSRRAFTISDKLLVRNPQVLTSA